MSDSPQTDIPELSNLSREDLEELLADPLYFQSIFYFLPRMKTLYQFQAELGSASEAITQVSTPTYSILTASFGEKILALQHGLYTLRSEMKDVFVEAKHLGARWKELEREYPKIHYRRRLRLGFCIRGCSHLDLSH
ncbi:hypothetical protein JAAARDRAFT_189792 [Jaapia argillacea MUCL 33604]|uniref:VPS37 C-terminal domain-containing protein n=1 Tax=Jaapia argillacea MUCL 33604 TaxID=933084 RepID=A0A067Q8K6_9AGAM|nr:hypothetical protein JAAARDRAFT_189792 [Jaapia argillacea MUCL 33604]